MQQTKPFLQTIGSIEFECLQLDKAEGKQTPNIIFLNGYRMNFKSWDKVYPEVAKQHNILLYNRLGIGKSAKADRGQAAQVVVQDLRELTRSLEWKPPFVLVAHSMGGLFADLYARTYPDEVAGIVFVDCPHPEEINEQKKFKLPKILQLVNVALNLIDKWFDRHVHSEDENIATTVAQIHNADDFPDIPISIVSGQKKMPFVPPAAFAMHQAHQQKLLDLSPNAKQYLCHNSGHFPQITEPDIVISSIVELMADIDSTIT